MSLCRKNRFLTYLNTVKLFKHSLNRFFTNINSVHRNIVFTKELETYNCLHVLDVLIEKTSTGFINSLSCRTTVALSFKKKLNKSS